MTELEEFARDTLAKQPFSVLLGTELTSISPGQVELALDIRQELQQQHGFAHGGLVSYLADNAITFAAGSLLRDSLTVEFKINYVRPGVGERLIARATVVHAGKRQAVARCDVFAVSASAERLCAVAQGTVSKLG